jgi:hypothetical protein
VHAMRDDDSLALAAIADVSSATARKPHIVNLTPVHPIDGTESQNSVEARQLAIDDKFFNLDHVSEGKRAIARRVDAREPLIPGLTTSVDKAFDLDHVYGGQREELKLKGLPISVDKSFDLNHVYGGKRDKPDVFDLDHVYGGKRATARVGSED